MHNDTVSDTANSIRQQSTALGIASRALDLNILELMETFEAFADGAQQVLSKQRSLLSALDADLAAIGAVRIHPVFLGTRTRRAIEAGEQVRTLGNYVDDNKMRQVAEGCAKLNGSSLHACSGLSSWC